jgi:hypothetical protein
MISTRTEWVYLAEQVEHLQEKDVDVVLKRDADKLRLCAENADVASHQGVASHQEELVHLRESMGLGVDM